MEQTWVKLLIMFMPSVFEIIKQLIDWIIKREVEISEPTKSATILHIEEKKDKAREYNLSLAKAMWPKIHEGDLRIYHEMALKIYRRGKTLEEFMGDARHDQMEMARKTYLQLFGDG